MLYFAFIYDYFLVISWFACIRTKHMSSIRKRISLQMVSWLGTFAAPRDDLENRPTGSAGVLWRTVEKQYRL